MANIFQTVPHDVLNYVIAPFLNAKDRTAFNQVNHPFERLHKKFPADYAMKKHLRAMKNKYNMMCRDHAKLLAALTDFQEKLSVAYQNVAFATAASAAANQAETAARRDADEFDDDEFDDDALLAAAALAARMKARAMREQARRVANEARAAAAEVAHVYFKIYSLLEDPLFAPVFKYDTRARNCVSESLERLYEDSESLEQTSDEMKNNLRTRCAEVQAYITTIPFVREIGTK
jgi:hypothetical protein